MKKTFKTLLLLFIGFFIQNNALQAQDRALREILLPDSLSFCKQATVPVKARIDGWVNDTFRISYQLGNRPKVEELVPKQTGPTVNQIEYTFRTLLTLPDSLNDTLRVAVAPDGYDMNNEKSMLMRSVPTYSLPFTEGFDSTRFPPLNWSATPVGYYDAGWFRSNNRYVGFDGKQTSVACFSEGYIYRYNERTNATLMLPALDFSAQKNPYLVFDIGQYNDTLVSLSVDVSTDCGKTFKSIYYRGGTYALPNVTKNNGWIRDSVNLIPYIDSTVLIRFYSKHGYREGFIGGLCLSNIRVYDAPIPTKDVTLNRIVSPTLGSFCPSNDRVPVQIEIKNTGAAVLDTFIVSYQMGTTPSVSDTVIHTLAFNQTFKYTFSKLVQIPQNGKVNLTTSVKVIGDTDSRNDALNITEDIKPRLNLPYSENFEGGYPTLYTFITNGSNPEWFYSDRLVTGSDGAPTKPVSSYLWGSGPRIGLVCPYLDLRNRPNPFLTFDMAYPRKDTIISRYRKQDTLLVQVSTDCGKTFKTVYQRRGDTLASSPRFGSVNGMEWIPNSAADWRRDTVDLTPFKDSIVLIRFASFIGGYAAVYLDNFKVEAGLSYDIGIIEKQKPVNTVICPNDRFGLPVRIVIRNNAFLPTDSVKLSYQLDTEGVVSETLVRRINPRDTVQYQFQQLLNVGTTGTHDLKIFVQLLNDENTTNDTVVTQVKISHEYTPNLLEDFELAAFPPLDWQWKLSKAKGWTNQLTVSSTNNQLGIVAVSGGYYGFDEAGAVESLISLPVNLRNTEKPIAIFDRFSPYFGGTPNTDTFRIDVSTDCGVTYKPTGYVKTGDALSTIRVQRYEPNASSDWKTDSLDLSAYKDSTIQLRFSRIFHQIGGSVLLDNVRFVSTNPKNVSLISLLNPVDTTPLCPDNPFVLSFKIRNDGTLPIDSFNIKYQIDNQTEMTEHIRFAIQPNTLKSFQMPFLLGGISAGQHKLRVVAQLAGDTDNTLDTLFQNITVKTSLKAPMYETFDNSTLFPPNDWVIQPSGANTWQKQTAINKYGVATPAAYFGNLNNKGLKDGLVTAPIDLKNTNKPRLRFDLACARFSNTSNDTLKVEISTDCGLNYKNIYLKSGATLATASNWASPLQWQPTAFLWRTDSVDLSAYADSPVLLRFVNIGNNGHQLYLDNIGVADSVAIVKTKDVSKTFSKVYPNPTTGDIVIVLDKQNAQPVKLELMNAQGQAIKTEIKSVWDTPQYKWSLDGLPTGIYMLNIYNNRQFGQHKIVLFK